MIEQFAKLSVPNIDASIFVLEERGNVVYHRFPCLLEVFLKTLITSLGFRTDECFSSLNEE